MTQKDRTIDIVYEGIPLSIEGDWDTDDQVFTSTKIMLDGHDLDALRMPEDVCASIISQAEAAYGQWIKDEAVDREIDERKDARLAG